MTYAIKVLRSFGPTMPNSPLTKPHSLQIKALGHHALATAIILGLLYGVGWVLEEIARRLPSHRMAFDTIGAIDTYAMIAVAGLFAVELVALLAIDVGRRIKGAWKGEE